MIGTVTEPAGGGPNPRPARYTHGQHPSVLRSHRTRTAANSAGYLLEHLRPGLDLLDIGCGVGTITADLAAAVAPGRVTAVDTADRALAEAARTAADRGLTNVAFTAADVHGLDLPDDAFDVVHAHQVLQHVADPVLALREMRRVCRPGGVVAARDGDFASMSWYPEHPALTEWLAMYRRTARRNGGVPDAGRRLASWARRAGFTEVTASASSWCFATPAERAQWGCSWAERTTSSALAEQAVGYGLATRADLDRMAEAWLAWSAADDGWFAMLHGEIVCRP